MNIIIIGAGISGLSIGRMLNKYFDIEILEKNNEIGGIARTKNIDGVAFHTVGGHCLNSKNKSVMDFIFQEVMAQDEFHLIERNAKINLSGNYVSYPIEFSVKQIAEHNKDLAFNITKDFLSAKDEKTDNLADWFRQKFGNTLAEEYFIPYNHKIWQMDPKEMSHLWIEGKLPLPNKQDFFESLITGKKDTMPHSTFYYPNTNNQNTFLEALEKNLNIQTGYEVKSINQVNNKWIINNEKECDLVISTMPLNILPFTINNCPENIKKYAKLLRYNKVTNVFWKSKPVDRTWTYLPSKDTIFHRLIHIGNYHLPASNYTISESMGERSYEEMVHYGKKQNVLIEPLAYNVSDHAYVVYDQNYKEATSSIKEYLNDINLVTLGRFGEWEYFNMDICMESAMNIANKIIKNYKN